MNRKRFLVVSSCILLCLMGCGHGSGDHGSGDHGSGDHGSGDQGSGDHDPGDHVSSPAAHDPGHGSHGTELQLTLNNGDKWPVDEHTRTSAKKIAGLVNSSETIHSVEDARTLAGALDEELDVLVRGCTMTGPAHDQLHMFLVALFPKVEELKEKTDTSDLQSTREEIGSLLEAYENHFE